MNILMAGDIVGGVGRRAFAKVVREYKERGRADFVVANAENAAGGKGLTGVLAEELFAAGADVLTLGDHAWDQKELSGYLQGERRLLRPANFAPGCPGRGHVTVESGQGKVTVINLVGRTFMRPSDCPFRAVDAILSAPEARGRIVLVDMHAEATSEKIAMGRYLDGRVTCVAGTHTHVQTSDETVLPHGTAYLTDLGITGPKDSVLGREAESVLFMIKTGMHAAFKVAKRDPVLEGLWLDVDMATGAVRSLSRVRAAG